MKKKVASFISEKRHFLIAIAMLLVLAVVFSFYGTFVRESQGKGRSEYLYNSGETETIEVGRDGVGMRFTHVGPLYALGFALESSANVSGVLQLRMFSSTGEVISILTKDASEIKPGDIAGFIFSQPLEQPDGVYELEFTAETSETVMMVAGGETPDGWQLYNDGQPIAGALVMTGEVDRLGGFINGFYWALAAFVSLSIVGIYLLSRRRKIPLHRLYMAAILLLGILFCFVLPPYSSPDEQFHINETFTISSAWMGELPDEGIAWAQNVKRADDKNAVIENSRTTAFSYKEIVNNFFAMSKDSTATVYEGDLVGGYKLLYWPAALMVTLCRLLGFGFVLTLFLGRLANLLLYALLTTLAVKYAPFKKSVFALVGILPMSMHLAASFSRDALTIATYMFITAYTLHLISKTEKITLKNIVVLLLAMLFVIPAKVIYAPLVLLILLLPADKFKFGKREIPPKYVKWAKAGIVAVAGIIFVITVLPYIRSTLQQPLDPAAAGHPDDVRYTLPYILANFGDFFRLTLNTFLGNIGFYLNSLVGGKLSYFSIDIDWTYVIALYLLLFAATIPQKGESRLSKPVRRTGIALSVLCSLLVVYSCISWTPLHNEIIYGIQGRYFLPIIPLLLCCVGSKISAFETTKDIEKPLVFTGFSVSCLVAVNAFLQILSR